MTEKKESVKEYKDFSTAEKLRIVIRYKAWFTSCMKGEPLRSPIFTNAAAIVADVIQKRPQETDEDIQFAETYLAWHISCLEGKPLFDEEYISIANEVKGMFLSSDGRSPNPEFG